MDLQHSEADEIIRFADPSVFSENECTRTMNQAVDVAKRYVIRGRVQGVGYRFFVERHAQRIGLRGYAKNLGDGTVEVIAAGGPAALNELEGLLHQGPRLALVAGVEAQEAPMAEYSHFRVRV